MKKETKYALGGFIVGGLVVWSAITSINITSNSEMMNRIGLSASSQKNMMQNSNTMDQHFIEQMIPHHEDAITMAKLAPQKAQHEEIIQLSENIIDSQSKEINQMKSWYKSWFGKEVPTNSTVMIQHGMMSDNNSTHMGMMGDEKDMESLSSSSDFDREFIRQMIPHHQMAVMMANMLKNGTNRPEMRQLAEDIIKAQRTEIEQMRGWLNDWSK
jgi:uncharacterized protein (DUF305 family)